MFTDRNKVGLNRIILFFFYAIIKSNNINFKAIDIEHNHKRITVLL